MATVSFWREAEIQEVNSRSTVTDPFQPVDNALGNYELETLLRHIDYLYSLDNLGGFAVFRRS